MLFLLSLQPPKMFTLARLKFAEVSNGLLTFAPAELLPQLKWGQFSPPGANASRSSCVTIHRNCDFNFNAQRLYVRNACRHICSIRSGSKWCPVSQEIMSPSSIPSSIPMHNLQSCTSDQGSQSALLAPGAEHIALDVREHIDYDNIDLVGLQGFVTLNEIEANGLEEIEGDLRLKLILSDWQNRLRESQERKERKWSLSLNVKNEIYQLIGFFSVFQGVVLTTVAQASQLTCHNWWGPFALSLLASLMTLVGVGNKFHSFIKWKRATVVEVENSKVLKRQISHLKKFGAAFKFSEHAPDVPCKKKESVTRFKRYYILAVLVIVSMMGFSVIMLISCQRILCDKGSA